MSCQVDDIKYYPAVIYVCVCAYVEARLFGHVEQKDDNDWVKCCITWEVEGIKQRTPKKRPGGIVLRMTWKV